MGERQTDEADAFTDTDQRTEKWVDVRMTDPDAGEWDVDVVVESGRVEFVDLRIDPALLGGFIDCLIQDVAEDRAREIVEETAARHGIDLDAADV